MEDAKNFDLLPKLVPKSKKLLLVVLIFSAIAGCATMGYDSMMMASLIAVEQFSGYFSLSPTTMGLLNAGVWVGQMVSCFFMAYVCDKLGRKKTILFATLLNFIAIAIQTAAQNVGMFVFARFLLGAGIQLACGGGPVLIAELSPANIRGLMVGIYFTMFNAGAIIASAVTYGTINIPNTWAWRLPSVLQAVPSFLVIIMLVFTPESPRWKIMKNDTEYARQVYRIFAESEEEVDELVQESFTSIMVEKDCSENVWSELFSFTKPMTRRLVIGLSLSWLIEMGGSSVGSYYLTVLLRQAGIHDTTRLLQINMISSCWNFAVAFFASFLFDRLGRKKQALISLSGMIVCFLCLGGFIKKFSDSDNRSGQYATIFWVFLFNGFYSFCFTPLGDVYATEIFPTRIRVAGFSLVKFFDSGFGLLAAFVLPISMNAIGWKFYIINASYNLLFLPLIYFVWVETKQLSLEEIAEKLGDIKIRDLEATDGDSGDVVRVEIMDKTKS